MPCRTKEDQSISAKKHYAKHKNAMILRANIFTAQVRIRNRQFIYEHLLNNPCVDCGESDTIVLDFDHVIGDKVNNVTVGANKGWSLKKLKDEINKCEIRCANCHRRVTHNRRKK